MTISPSSGSASSEPQTVTVTVTDNTGSDRTATIKFTANNGTVSKNLTVKQTGPEETVYTTLAEIRELAPTSTDATANIPDGVKVKVFVVSNAELNNSTSQKNIYVQDETAGIQIRFTGNNELLQFGDEVEIDLSGQELAYYAESLQINNLPNEAATVLSSGNELTPQEISMEDFLANRYEGRYVALAGVQVVSSDLEKTFVMNDNHTSIGFEDAQGNTFVVFSSKYSTFGSTSVPQGSGTLKGIATKNYENIQIMFAQLSDFDGLTGARFEGTEPEPVEPVDVTVAEFLAAPVSTDVWYRLKGTVGGPIDTQYGNFDIIDETGKVYVYGTSNFSEFTVNEGDNITIVGQRGKYGDKDEVLEAYIEEVIPGEPVEPTEPIEATIAEFLAAPVSSTQYYILTGTISNIVNTSYGNFTLTDETGAVYVYGLTAKQVDKNDQSFSTLGLKEGDTVTLCGTRAEFGEDPQVGGPAYYISHEPGTEEPEEPADPDSPFVSNVTWTLGTNSYNEKATVNGEGPVDVVKIGKSKAKGSIDITLPAGTTKVNFYAVSWNNETATLSFMMGGEEVGFQAIAKNAGAANSQPYTFTVTESDYYTFNTPMPLPSDMTITVTTQENARAILWGIKAITE